MTLKAVMEALTGKASPVTYNELPGLFNEVRSQLFPNLPIFNEEHRIPLENLIMGRYLTREICCTPWARWQIMFNQKLMEIMPTMNRLYEALETNTNIFDDTNYTRTYNTTGNKTMKKGTVDETVNEGITTQDGTFNPGTTRIDTHSGTPQTELTNFLDDKYITDADKSVASGQDTSQTTTDVNSSGSIRRSGQDEDIETRQDTEKIVGKRSGLSYAELITKFKNELFSVDQMVLDALDECFFMLY